MWPKSYKSWSMKEFRHYGHVNEADELRNEKQQPQGYEDVPQRPQKVP